MSQGKDLNDSQVNLLQDGAHKADNQSDKVPSQVNVKVKLKNKVSVDSAQRIANEDS